MNEPDTSLDVLDAESEGEIGFILQNALANALPSNQDTVAVLTQVQVNLDDPAFNHPTKPIGRWYDDDSMAQDKGWTMAKDGDKYRRVVPSPKPHRIIEARSIKLLLDAGVLVICCGGGGIPVATDHGSGKRHGVEAVIDKDASAALLAKQIHADFLLILTDEEAVYNPEVWPKEKQPLRSPIHPDEISRFKFASGSMGPKIEASVGFVQNTGGKAGIGKMTDALKILKGQAGTIIAMGL